MLLDVVVKPGVDGGVKDFVLLPELATMIGGVWGGVCSATCFCCHDDVKEVTYDGGACGNDVGVVAVHGCGATGATAV